MISIGRGEDSDEDKENDKGQDIEEGKESDEGR